MTKPYRDLIAARVAALEEATGRKLLRRHTKGDLAAGLFVLTAVHGQKPNSRVAQVLTALFERCRGSHGLDVGVTNAELMTATGIADDDHVRRLTVDLDRRFGLIVRVAAGGRITRYCITEPAA
jgi:hypothetical protein